MPYYVVQISTADRPADSLREPDRLAGLGAAIERFDDSGLGPAILGRRQQPACARASYKMVRFEGVLVNAGRLYDVTVAGPIDHDSGRARPRLEAWVDRDGASEPRDLVP